MFLPHLKNRVQEPAAAVVVSVAIESTAKPATVPEPAPEPLPNFGDTVQTPDGRTGTMRGSGGMGSDRVQVENTAGNRSWHNRSELRRVQATTEPTPEPEELTAESGSVLPPSEDFSDENGTVEDFAGKERAVIEFGKELEANRIASIQGVQYMIDTMPDRSGFRIVITNAEGYSENIVSGFYGYAFDTFDRTVSYAVSKARSRFVCHPETFQNGCQIEKRYHNRRAVFVYVVTLPEPVKGSKFDTLETRAKRFGGWYAREYRPEYQRGGFMFTDKRQADRFANDFTPSAKVATMRHNDTTEPDPKQETPSGDFSDRQPKEPGTFGDILKQLTEEPFDSSPIAFFGHVFSIHGKPPGQTITTEPGKLTLTVVRPDGAVSKIEGFGYFTECANAIAEVVRRAMNLPGFITPEDERRDAETRVDALGRQSRWTVRGFCGTSGPPSVFDRKRDAIDYAVANRRAILGRWCGAPATYPENWPTQETPSGNFSEAEPAPVQLADEATAAKLEELADGMQKTIDEKTRPMTQNWTRKRGEEYAHRMHDGENLERCQKALRVLAAHWRAGTVPAILKTTKTKTAVLKMVSEYRERENSRPFEGNERFHDKTPLAAKLRGLVADASGEGDAVLKAERERRKAIEKAEERLRVCDVAGFFPTPKQAAVRVLNAAQIPETPPAGFSILEPSCGIGSLLELVADLHPELVPAIDCIETWSAAADVTELKGFGPVHRTDFLSVDVFDWGRTYDRILMNPPFEDLQGIDHVKHAFNFLKPGGRLVAILPDGYFQTSASRRKVQDFQLFVDDLNGETFPLANAFTGSDAFRQTGVSVRVLILDAPE